MKTRLDLSWGVFWHHITPLPAYAPGRICFASFFTLTEAMFWLLYVARMFAPEMSGNVFFNPIPYHSQWFIPIPSPRFSLVLFPFPSHSHWLFPFPPLPFPFGLVYSASSLRLCCWSSSGSQRSSKSLLSLLASKRKLKAWVTVRQSSRRSWCSTTDGSFSSSDYKWENIEFLFPPIPTKPLQFPFPFP